MQQNPNLTFLAANLPSSRVVALQGGTRSGKTYATLQYLISLAVNYSGLKISVVRQTFPAVRATVLADFKEILQNAGLYDPEAESKPPGTYEYELNGNLIEFFAVDNEQKVRGRKRHILYINEANEITLDKYRQLAFRTTDKIIVDYNPSEPESYIYEHLLPRPDCRTIITTYRDNPHLPQAIIDEIELLKDADEDYWRVFGEGQRGNVSGLVFGHYKVLLDEDWPKGKGKVIYGTDFGYSAPSAIVEVTDYDEAIYVRELLYERKLTNPMLIKRSEALGIDKKRPNYMDAAEPDRIAEFVTAGYTYAEAANKTMKAGIDSIRAKPLYVHAASYNLLNELKGYRYRKVKGTNDNAEEPIAIYGDHALDATRYAVYSDKVSKRAVSHEASVPMRTPSPFGRREQRVKF